MHYLIDGHNLIAALSTIALDDPNDEAELIMELRRWSAAGKGRRITLFFDAGLPGGKRPLLSSSTLEIIFASHNMTADDLIVNRIKKITNSSEYLLVSSDREVKNAANRINMKNMSAQEFASQLEQRNQQKNNSMEIDHEKPEPPPMTEGQLSEWLRMFESEPEKPD